VEFHDESMDVRLPEPTLMAGREQFTVGMERSGCRLALRRGKGLSNAQPREGGRDGDKRSAESLGGIAFRLRDRRLGFTMEAARGRVLSGVVVSGGCCGRSPAPFPSESHGD